MPPPPAAAWRRRCEIMVENNPDQTASRDSSESGATPLCRQVQACDALVGVGHHGHDFVLRSRLVPGVERHLDAPFLRGRAASWATSWPQCIRTSGAHVGQHSVSRALVCEGKRVVHDVPFADRRRRSIKGVCESEHWGRSRWPRRWTCSGGVDNHVGADRVVRLHHPAQVHTRAMEVKAPFQDIIR